MQLWHRKPGPLLARFVQTLWLFEGGPQAHTHERALPDGCLQVIINLREDRHRIYDRSDLTRCRTLNGCLVVGPQTEFCVIDTPARMSLAGIHFKPGGAFPFFAPPLDELHASHIPLDALWGNFAAELRERLLEAATPEERLSALEQALSHRLARAAIPHPAIDCAIHQLESKPAVRTIAELADQTGFSSRHFIARFRQQVGFTPKLFCRLRRFHRALERIASGHPIDWADLALETGYFDQAHFIHDFKAFSGINPSTYCASRPWHMNHVPLGD
jgi:AraC-like DNA-binding protein